MITLEPPRGAAGEANPWLKLGLSQSGLARFLHTAQRAAGLEGEIHVLLTGDRTLRRLNRTFRGKDQVTDVLSFPAMESAGIAGDLAVSLETAARQAKRFRHTLRDEVRVLLLHGVLHLAGFDHEADSGEMAAREAELRRELRLTSGLIARVGSGKNEDKNRQKRNTGVLRSAQDDKLREDGKLKKVRRRTTRKRVRA